MNKNNQKTSSQMKSISTNTLIIAQEEEKGLKRIEHENRTTSSP